MALVTVIVIFILIFKSSVPAPYLSYLTQHDHLEHVLHTINHSELFSLFDPFNDEFFLNLLVSSSLSLVLSHGNLGTSSLHAFEHHSSLIIF